MAPVRGVRPLVVGLVISAFLAGCGSGVPASDGPRMPRLTDVPARPAELPTAAELAERRLRLESDRDAALDPENREPAQEPAPELTEILEDLPVVPPAGGLPEDRRGGVSVQVATIRFASRSADSVDLDDQMIAALGQVVREQRSIGGGIRVIGHGGNVVDEDLTRRQIAMISQVLADMGVPPARIETELAEPGSGEGGDHGRAVIYLDY